MSELLATAIEAAHAAAAIHEKYPREELVVSSKGDHLNLVSNADREAEQVVVEIIRRRYPDHNIMGEEDSYAATASSHTWVIDPIDGTSNFLRGIPQFAVSIAVAEHGLPLAGVVYDTSRRELFSAERGRGAALNSRPIRVSTVDRLDQAVLATGFYYNRGGAAAENLEVIGRFFEAGLADIRRFAAASLDLCWVACGRLDGYWEVWLYPWDFAAGWLIVEEAGGRLSDRAGSPFELKPGYIVSSNGRLHTAMLDVLGRGA
jgi:myo-inositol-1(or 4)-monophosphatase